MSITYNASIPKDGNPEGIIDAPKGTWFHKTGSFYKQNNTGSFHSSWENVYFKPYSSPNYYLTAEDMPLLTVNTGSYLYVKNSVLGTRYGWAFVSYKTPFLSPQLAATPPAPETIIYYNDSQSPPGAFAHLNCGDNVDRTGIVSPWTLTLQVRNSGSVGLYLQSPIITSSLVSCSIAPFTEPTLLVLPGGTSSFDLVVTLDAPVSCSAYGLVIINSNSSINPSCGISFTLASV